MAYSDRQESGTGGTRTRLWKDGTATTWQLVRIPCDPDKNSRNATFQDKMDPRFLGDDAVRGNRSSSSQEAWSVNIQDTWSVTYNMLGLSAFLNIRRLSALSATACQRRHTLKVASSPRGGDAVSKS